MKKEITIMINEVVDGVKFQNLPAFIDAKGKILYPLNPWAVAELIASKIQQDVKGFVTVNFSSVDVKPFLRELNNGKELVNDNAEKAILNYVFGDIPEDK